MCRWRSGGSWSGKAEAWCSEETGTLSLHLNTHICHGHDWHSRCTAALIRIPVTWPLNTDSLWSFPNIRWTPACVYWEGCDKGCCLRKCIFVQSGTVSVQPQPWFGLVVLTSLFLWPTSSTQWVWGGAESLSLSVSEFSSLLQTGGSQLLISYRPCNPKPIHLIPCSYSPPFSSKSTFYFFSPSTVYIAHVLFQNYSAAI